MCRSVARSPLASQITVNRVEEPERRVGGVIDALVFAVGEIVRDQAVADVLGEGAEDVARFVQPPGAYGQPFEADHRVAAPIREPMIAGDDGTDFVAAQPVLGRRLRLGRPG